MHSLFCQPMTYLILMKFLYDMNNTLWEQKNYLLDIDYLIATTISEYDIRKANISILYSEGVIDKQYYDYLYSADRMTRQVEVGYMIKNNKEVGDILSQGIAKYRKAFFNANNLLDNDILSIKNDAIFVMKKKPQITTFGNIEFVNKNNYSSFIKILRHKEIYFRSDMVNQSMVIDIKGISDENLEKHKDYMLRVIGDIIYFIEVGDIKSGLNYLKDFYNQYISRTLPIEYYRNFDEESKYVITVGTGCYKMDTCLNNKIKEVIDISCNVNVIRDLYGILINIYFSKNKSR